MAHTLSNDTQHLADGRRERPLVLLSRSVGWPWLLLAFLARLPVATLPLALLVYGEVLTGSFAASGLMVGALSLGGVVGAPLVGALADRVGARRTLCWLTAPAAVGILGLIALTWWPAPLGVALALAAFVGASNAQVSAMARASWSARFSGEPDARHRVEIAMGYETVADEVSYVLGPVVGATLATAVSPVAALVVALLILIFAQLGFAALMRGRQAPVTSLGRRINHPGLLVPWVLIALAVGLVFGTVQTGVTASLAGTPAASFTGVVYAFIGVGSAASGTMTHRLVRWSLPARVIAAGLLLAVAGTALTFAAVPVALGASCFAVGLCVAPLLISSFAAAERLATAGNTLVLTLLSTATLAGVGLGASIAGVVVDTSSPSTALALLIALGLACSLLGLLARALPTDAFGSVAGR